MLGEVEFGQYWIGTGKSGEKAGDVGFLVVLGRACAGEGTVFGASKDEVLSCKHTNLAEVVPSLEKSI